MVEMHRKPWYHRIQFFFPWSSLYVGVQFDNNTKFLWQWRQIREEEIG